MKKLVITALAILTVFGLTACGNVQTADKNVETSATTSASANTVTTVTTSSATTSVGDVVTTAPTSTSEGEPIVTTSATTSTAPEEVATTTTTVATKKPVTTTTKKVTTTTKKTTTTTAKKTTTTAKKTTTTAKKTNKVTTTTTAKKQVKLTQSDIDRLVKELQEYSNSKAVWVTENWQEFRGYGIEYTTLEEFFDYLCEDETPENNPNWTAPVNLDECYYTFEEAYKRVKEAIDYDYSCFPDEYLFLYARYYPKGEGCVVQSKKWVNGVEVVCDNGCWEIFLLR